LGVLLLKTSGTVKLAWYNRIAASCTSLAISKCEQMLKVLLKRMLIVTSVDSRSKRTQRVCTQQYITLPVLLSMMALSVTSVNHVNLVVTLSVFTPSTVHTVHTCRWWSSFHSSAKWILRSSAAALHQPKQQQGER